MNLATWNVNSLHVRLPQVLDWLAQHPEVGVLALQETKTTDDKFPIQAFVEAGYRVEVFGQKPTTAWRWSAATTRPWRWMWSATSPALKTTWRG